MRNYLSKNNVTKSFWVILLAIFLPLNMHAEMVEEPFDAYDYYDGILMTQISTFSGNSSFSFTSKKSYPNVVSVVVRVGVGDYLYGNEYSSGAMISVNGQERDVTITNTNRYMGSTSNLEMDDLAFELNGESGEITVGGSIGNGTCDFYIESIVVYYEKDESIIEYPIWVRKYDVDKRDYVDIQVTSENRLDIMGDGGKLQYNGGKMLVLNSPNHLSGITTEIEDMILYLKGDNKIEAGSGTALSWSKSLIVTTEGNDPGSLTLTCYSPSLPLNTQGIIFEQNLVYIPPTSYGSVRTGKICVPIDPLVNLSNTSREVSVTTNGNLDNKVYDDVLYNLKSEDGNGYDATTQSILMATTMHGEDVDAIISNYKPGSYEYSQNFAGITFLVPAGTGKAIVVGHTSDEGVLNVKIGNNTPYVIPSGVPVGTRFTFPYDVEEATYVYVYSDSPIKTVEAAGDRRAGKKTTVTVGVGSVGVEANTVQNSNPNPGDATAIKTIVSKEQKVVRPQVWYSISGHRLQGVPTQKGLYIFGGRKYVIK